MEKCKKSQKLFLYTNSRKVKNVYHYIFHMKDAVEYDLLAESARKIFPYFQSLAISIYKDEKDFYYNRNENVLPIFSEIKDDFVLIEDSNGYPFAVRCQGNDIRFDFSHACMDGFASQKFIQYLLGNYIYLKYGETIDPVYIEKKTEEEIELSKLDFSDSSILKNKFDKMTEEVGFEPEVEISKTCNRFVLIFDEKQLNDYIEEKSIKLYSILIGLLARTFENIYGQKPSVGFPINLRRRLFMNESLNNCSSEVIIPMPLAKDTAGDRYYELIQENIDKIVKSDTVLFNIQKCFEFVDLLENQDYPIAKKQRIFRSGMAPRTFHFSHMNRFPHIFEGYIEDIDLWVPVFDYPLYVVNVRYAGKVKLNITHSFDEETLFPELINVLDQSKLNYKIVRYEPIKDGTIEYRSL